MTMRHVTTDRDWRLVAGEAPTVGRGVDHYQVLRSSDGSVVQDINFQDGPLKEVGGVNGVTNEMLISAVIDRLEHFQAHEQTRCRENAMVITKLEEALHWLRHRTQERLARGVEGTYAK